VASAINELYLLNNLSLLKKTGFYKFYLYKAAFLQFYDFS